MAESSSNRWLTWLLVVVAVAAVAAAIYLYLHPRTTTLTTTKFQMVPQIREVEKIKRVYVPCPQAGVVALDKAEVAEKLDLPWLKGEANQGTAGTERTEGTEGKPGDEAAKLTARAGTDDFDESQLQGETPPVPGRPADLQPTATASLPESPNGYDVINIFNTATGSSDIVAKEKDSPWFDFRNKYGLGLRYGVGVGNGQPLYTGTLYGFWEFLRVKNIYFTGYGEATSDGAAKAQVDMQWRSR